MIHNVPRGVCAFFATSAIIVSFLHRGPEARVQKRHDNGTSGENAQHHKGRLCLFATSGENVEK